MKQLDVVALGELLIDFTMNGVTTRGNPLMEANPGGAPCNVLAALSKFGKKTAFIGKVGKDQFGEQLKRTLKNVGIDTCGLRIDPDVHTTLAFVHKLPNDDRDFSFYRNPGADMMLTEEDIDLSLIDRARVFHCGTLSMTHERIRRATVFALERAKESGAYISFDPNLRPPLWDSLETAKECFTLGMSYCNILKISDEEIKFFTGLDGFDEGINAIRGMFPNISLIFLTLGKNGSIAYYKNLKIYCPGFTVKTVDTCGAGDVFYGSALTCLLETGLNQLDADKLKKILIFSNAAAALVTTKHGGISSIPELEEVKELIGHR